ncbi:MAG TPA: mannosyltransferase family protein [Candidatus Dormibacteraeota bacterium]|nr:mannosyltransferase family protein [Candidatus Dormibacteraeota bacterium]
MHGAGGTQQTERVAWWRRALSVDPALPQALGIVVGLRVGLGIVAAVTLTLIPSNSVGGDWLDLQLPTDAPAYALLAPWERWDALWYHHLALSGYHTASDAAFFPLYPTLIRGLASLLGNAYLLSGLVISTIAYLVALVLLHRLVRMERDAATADRTLLYLALAPTAFFLLAPYTEALFLALTVATFLALRRRTWVAAGGLAALAALTRPTGILIVAPLLVAFVRDVRERRRKGARALAVGHVTLLLPLAALAAWLLYTTTVLHIKGGPAAAYAPWTNGYAAPWTVLTDSWNSITAGHHVEEAFNLGAIAVLVAAIAVMWRRLPGEYTAYSLVLLPVLLTREVFFTPLASAARYVVVVFPVFVVLAMAGRRLWLHRAVVAVSAPLMAMLFIAYVRFSFVG